MRVCDICPIRDICAQKSFNQPCPVPYEEPEKKGVKNAPEKV